MLPFPKRSLFVPEVVQTSAMDCGPACLKSLLGGFGISVSYGRLREACQTDVDGTSIDTLEEIARDLGLEAEQVLIPVDHLLLPEAETLPAIVVVRLPMGFTHFVVVWRAHGGLVQLMDPGTGRRWTTKEAFLRDVYTHSMAVPAEGWREFACSPAFLRPLAHRIECVGATRAAERLLAEATADPSWRSLAALDAATRMTTSLVESGGISRGRDASNLLEELYRGARDSDADSEAEDDAIVPPIYWSARADKADDDGEAQVSITGAVLVHVRGKRGAATTSTEMPSRPALSPELIAALEEPPSRPGRDLLRALREDGLLTPAALVLGLALGAAGTVLEAVLFRSLFDIGRQLDIVEKRVSAFVALLLFLAVLLLLELPLASGILRIGRRLDGRFRMAFLRKVPRLGDRYFQSRPISDMAERSHSVHALRLLPGLGAQVLRETAALLATAIGIAWLDRSSAPIAACVAGLAFAIPLVLQRPLEERDLRVRNHGGALSRWYLDALLGLVPVRAHGAEPALRREHESLLVEWADASRARDRLAIGIEAIQALVALGLASWLFLSYYARTSEPGGALLLLYWALSLPAHGRELALAIRQYPAQRNTALRVLEPLGAIEERQDEVDAHSDRSVAPRSNDEAVRGVALRFEGVSVRAGGHAILEEVDLAIEPGAHVAIVGASGAGKSSLVGVLLGWHRAAQGQVLVDGQRLDARQLDGLRATTAWVDPTVQLWNRSLLDNLVYGASDEGAARVGEMVEEADLRGILEALPDGLATALGEGGGLVSGGEGQRIRLGRAALGKEARLVVLDEPFRGLDREKRRQLLARARRWWPNATLLCITHDVGETRDFERVVIVERGRIIEDGRPKELVARPDSRYAALLAAEEEVRIGMWSDPAWRRIHLAHGVVHELPGGAESEQARLPGGAKP